MSDYHLLELKPRNGVTIELIASPTADDPSSFYLWVNDHLIESSKDISAANIQRLMNMAQGINELVKSLLFEPELAAAITGRLERHAPAPDSLPTPVTRAAWPKDPPIREWESEWPMNDGSLIAELIQLKSGFVSPNDIRRIADEALAFVHAMIPVGEKLRAGWMLESHRLGDNHPIVKETEAAVDIIRKATTVRPIPAE